MIFPTFKITTVREKWRHTISSIASSASVRYQLPFSAALSRSSPAVRPITISAVWQREAAPDTSSSLSGIST